jgi:hypothetical protein
MKKIINFGPERVCTLLYNVHIQSCKTYIIVLYSIYIKEDRIYEYMDDFDINGQNKTEDPLQNPRLLGIIYINVYRSLTEYSTC